MDEKQKQQQEPRGKPLAVGGYQPDGRNELKWPPPGYKGPEEDSCPKCHRDNVPIGVETGLCLFCDEANMEARQQHKQILETARRTNELAARGEKNILPETVCLSCHRENGPIGETSGICADCENAAAPLKKHLFPCDKFTLTGIDEAIEAWLEMMDLKNTALRAKARGKTLRICIDWKEEGQSQLRVWEESKG